MNIETEIDLSSDGQILLAVVNNLDGVVYSVDADFCLTSFNAEFKREMKNIFDLDVKTGDHVYGFLTSYYPEDVDFWEEMYNRAFAGKRIRFEKIVEYTSPPSHWDFSFNPIYSNDKVVGLACYTWNVTLERKKELQLLQTQELFQLIAENQMLGIVWATAAGKMIDANDTFCKILDSSLQDLLEVYYGDYTFPDDLEVEKPLFEKLKNGIIDNYVLEKRYITRKGVIKWVKVNLSSSKNKAGRLKYITCIVQEIGERKNAETLLAKSEINLRAILDHTSASCLLLDNDSKIVAYNKLAENWMNIYFNHAFQPGENFLSLVPAKYQSLVAQVLQVAASGTPYRYTGKYQFEEGVLNWYDVQVAPAFNEQNQVRGIVISAVDITREKTTKQKLKHSMKRLKRK